MVIPFLMSEWVCGATPLCAPCATAPLQIGEPVLHSIPARSIASHYRFAVRAGTADVAVGVSLGATLGFLMVCLGVVWWIFRTGYRLKN
jgi:hypothetical protein